jgi:putative transposase
MNKKTKFKNKRSNTMGTKIRPSEEKSKRLKEIYESESIEVLKEFMKGAMEKVYQEILEQEADDFIGRGWYERKGSGGEEKFRGYRNGYSDKRIKTSEGKLQLRKPRIRDSNEKFTSKILTKLDMLEERLNKLALEMYIRGLSTRDIESSLQDTNGKAMISRTGISNLSKNLYKEYEEFRTRDLSEYDVVYLFVDGVYESIRRYTNGQTILCAWAILSDSRKIMIDLAAVTSESEQAWTGFFEELIKKGLRQPLVVVSDGAKGLTKAITMNFPYSDRQRCIVHKMRNVLSKVNKQYQEEIKKALHSIYYSPTREVADILSKEFIDKYSERLPSAVKCFADDLEACLVHLSYPACHHKYIRTTNLIERSFQEEKRRTKVFPQHQHERGCLGLVFAVLIRASEKWYNVQMSDIEISVLKRIRNLMYPKFRDNDKISFVAA